MTTIAVIGGSKGIGRATVKDALVRGWRVRCISRDPGQVGISHAYLTLVPADATSQPDLEKAIAGCDAVVSTIGRGPMIGGWTDMFSKHAHALVAAMQAASVKRVVMVTGYGAGDTRGRGSFLYDRIFQPLLLGAIYADKDKAEEILKDSDLDWTIVRPGILNDRPATNAARAITDPAEYKLGSIPRADVADFICDEIASPRHIRMTPALVA